MLMVFVSSYQRLGSSLEKSLVIQERPEVFALEDEEENCVRMHCCQWLLIDPNECMIRSPQRYFCCYHMPAPTRRWGLVVPAAWGGGVRTTSAQTLLQLIYYNLIKAVNFTR